MRLLLPLLAVALGCAGLSEPLSRDDGGDGGASPADAGSPVEQQDGGPGMGLDAGAGADAGPSVPAFEGIPADPERFLDGAAEDPSLGATPGAGRATCYDELDNDGFGGLDCAVDRCRALASCCVDAGDCCAPMGAEAPLPAELVFDCGDAPLESCLAVEPFGQPRPFVDDAALAFGGDAEFDSGLLVGAPVDLRTTRVRVGARFAHGACEGSCLESAAMGFTAQAALDDETHVRPLVALQLSPSREAAHVLVGDAVVARLPLGEEEARWELELRPTGEAFVWRDETQLARVRYATVREARLVLWGHSRNPGATDVQRARLLELDASAERCGMADAWEGPSELGLDAVSEPARVSVVEAAGARWMLVLGEGSGADLFRDDAAVEAAALPEGAREATLAAGPSGELELWYLAGPDARLHRAPWTEAEDVGAPLPEGFAAPSVLHHRGHEIVVAEGAGGLVLLARGPATMGAWRDLSEGLGGVPAGARAPSLIVHGDAYLLHYGTRSGTRWYVGLLASDELLAWRDVGARVFAGGAAFDARGASAPSVLSEGDALRLHYVAHDGVTRHLATTRRVAPRAARFEEAS